MMNDCQHRKDQTCLIATSLAGKKVTVDESVCEACGKDKNPQTFNKVVCSILYRETKHYRWIGAWNRCNNTFYDKPGSHLRKMFREIGIATDDSCGCDEFAAKMDDWGVQGCLLRKQAIVDHLNSQSVSWLDMAKVLLAGYLTTSQIVDECISRAKVIYGVQ